MKARNNNYSAIILAGGRSSRMNYPKPWIEMNNGATFLEEIVSVFANFGIADIIVVLNGKFATKEWSNELTKIEKTTKIIKNSSPEKGRLFSLQLGLRTVKNENIFIQNVDNPFVKREVLKQLADNSSVNKITIPTYLGKGGHPVVINNEVKNEIVNNYQHYETLKEVFSNFPKKYIEVNNNSILKNINTPQELEEVKYELA